MPAIVLRDQEDQDIGFLLVAGGEPISTSGGRNVIFMVLPFLTSSDLADFVQRLKHREFNAQITLIDASNEISFAVNLDISFRASIRQSGTGQ
jgi:hypothetical protein